MPITHGSGGSGYTTSMLAVVILVPIAIMVLACVLERFEARAVQLGCRPPVPVIRDGVPGDRPVARRSWYRHTQDWLLVSPRGASGGR